MYKIELTRNAAKDLKKVPEFIQIKLLNWIRIVEEQGLQHTRKIPGWHDEPLKGVRRGQRSIRLNSAYRAIYTEQPEDGLLILIEILEVNKHKYRSMNLDERSDMSNHKNLNAKEALEAMVGELTFARLLKAERMAEGLTQDYLAEKIGVTKQAVSRFESGKDFPSYQTIKKIAKVFKMDEESYVTLLLKDILKKKGIVGYVIEVSRTET